MRKLICILLSIICLSPVFSARAQTVLEAINLPETYTKNENYVETDIDTIIVLSDTNPSVEGKGAAFSEDKLLISAGGVYLLSGSMHGSIEIDSVEEDKVTLIFNGVHLISDKSSCLTIWSSGKNTTIVLVNDSVNLLQATLDAETEQTDNTPDAAIYSKADLKFKGTGALYINASGGKGINCRDDITIEDVALYITAADDGLRGKDSVSIASGLIRIHAGADGIRSNNESKGNITISGGDIQIESALDGIQAHTSLSISGGRIICVTGGGAKEGEKTRENAFDHGFHGDRGKYGWDMDKRSETSEDTSSESAKGIKAELDIFITGGTITADCLDDALHANQNMTISGGELHLASGDDGIHADNALYIQNGNITISQSYEGIEAADLQISGGEIRLHASDDGINAAGAQIEASSAPGNYSHSGRGFGSGMGMMSETSGNMTISGGYVVVNSTGDGVDVNGCTEMSGGTLIIYGPSNQGNAALDYDRTFLVSGGTLLATGSSGMAQTVTPSGEMQMLAFTCNIPADTILHIADSRDTALCTFSSEKSYSCVIFVSDQMNTGESYQVYAQGEYSLPAVDGLYNDGVYTPGTLLGTIDL